MTGHPPLDQWTAQVAAAFPQLTRPQATVLALYSFGMILAQRCGLSRVVTVLLPLLHVGSHTLRSRLQEFYQPAAAKSGRQRDQLDVTTCFAPLLAWILQGWRSTRLALAWDATSLGDRFTVLSISTPPGKVAPYLDGRYVALVQKSGLPSTMSAHRSPAWPRTGPLILALTALE